ncbi:MAG: hypothetical protein Q7R96_03950 [Nanoarchaeota archaeon]|nr:hypothetical protein [Nanoarchaeota archaeon]
MEPKVLVGCPTSDHKAYCLEPYIEGLKKLTYKNKDILIVDNSATDNYMKRIQTLGIPVIKDEYLRYARDRIVHSRNILREKTINEEYEYFLSLEQDVIPPPNIIETLLKAKKQVITGVYYNTYKFFGKEKIRPLIWGPVEGHPDHMQFLTDEAEKPQIMQIKASGLGCILIHVDVLKKIHFSVGDDSEAFDDIYFCKDLEKNNIPLYTDTTMKCKHLIKGMRWDDIQDAEKHPTSK